MIVFVFVKQLFFFFDRIQVQFLAPAISEESSTPTTMLCCLKVSKDR